jgi:site-specific recombinase XerC
VIAWRKDMEARQPRRLQHPPQTLGAVLAVRLPLRAQRNAVAGNPVNGVKRPVSHAGEGTTPALGDRQARALLQAPAEDTLKGIRDHAILATLLYHGIRREELCPYSQNIHAASRW